MPLQPSKLQIPRLRAERITRRRLLERLDAGLSRSLTLISAPAGFGKTTLAAEWVAGCPRPSAWLSLDEGDSDSARFLAYLVGALQTIEDEAGQATLAALAAAGPRAALPAIMPLLVTEIEAIPEESVLVLDDYHLIDAQPIHDALTHLVEHMPQRMHLVITTRADPPLPLARLRARGHLNELRQADLRFTPEEAADLLQQAVSGVLSPEQIEVLNDRTEGWIAGLQMAALALQELPAKPGLPPAGVQAFIQAFSGTQRHILDYLVEEVLTHQPAQVQSFLLQTSILERLCGPLCDAVVGGGTCLPDGVIDQNSASPAETAGSLTGQQMLERLERTNLFVAPLDDRREWYRYHRLFADLLRQRLRAASTSTESGIASLHRRAATWYEGQGMLPEAIRHMLAAGDYQAAAGAIERAAPIAWKQGELATLQEWMESLPAEVLPDHPLLYVYSATVMLLCTASVDRVEPLVRLAADSDPQGRLRGEVHLLRALVAMFRGDLPGGRSAAQLAVQLLPRGSVFRGLAVRTLSALHLLAGDLAAADRLLEQDLAIGEAAGDRMGLSASLRRLGSLAVYRGELAKARSLYQRALDQSRDASGRPWPVAGRVLTHLGELALEENRLDEAQEFITQAVDLLDHFIPGWNSGAYVLLARLRHALRDESGARQALETARERARGTATAMDDVYLEVQAARLALMQHDLESAERWASVWASPAALAERPQAQDIETLVNSRVFSEMVQTTLARLHLALGQPGEALAVLARLDQVASSSGVPGNRIESLVLCALAKWALGQSDAAMGDIEMALRLAEREGFVRTFIDEGQAIAPLLQEASRRGIAPAHVGRLLAALEESVRERPAAPVAPPGTPPPTGRRIEPLTERELEVLRLLRTALTTPEIASELGVAPSTVRTFVKNLYGKLGVHRRLEAIDRAKELGLLSA
jgi:LuxR family maltose regulon positive regulatory protein